MLVGKWNFWISMVWIKSGQRKAHADTPFLNQLSVSFCNFCDEVARRCEEVDLNQWNARFLILNDMVSCIRRIRRTKREWCSTIEKVKSMKIMKFKMRILDIAMEQEWLLEARWHFTAGASLFDGNSFLMSFWICSYRSENMKSVLINKFFVNQMRVRACRLTDRIPGEQI